MTYRVVHLVGSPVSEFFADLSRLYATDCLEATADPSRYETHIAYVRPDGSWCFPDDLSDEAIGASPTMAAGAAIEHLQSLRPDVAVPQLFCRPGMTSYRALLDVLRIPHVGNRADVMAVGADKALARAAVAAAGVRVPYAELVDAADAIVSLAPPAVVKPRDSDNSVGVTLVRNTSDYPAALRSALEHSSGVLVERYIDLGREVRCGIFERDGELICLPVEEYAVDATTKPIRDQADKLRRDAGGRLHLVAKDAEHAWIVPTDDPVTERVWDVARRCHRALGCRDYSLFDFRIDPDGTPWFLEAGLYNSFARQSVLCVMAAQAGIDVPELFDICVRAAVARR